MQSNKLSKSNSIPRKNLAQPINNQSQVPSHNNQISSNHENYEQSNQQAYYNPPQINVNVNNVVNATATATASIIYSRKSRWVALILCLFLGFLGVHRFYLGKTFTGVVFLVTAGLGGLGVVWDLVMLVMNNAKDGNGMPLS